MQKKERKKNFKAYLTEVTSNAMQKNPEKRLFDELVKDAGDNLIADCKKNVKDAYLQVENEEKNKRNDENVRSPFQVTDASLHDTTERATNIINENERQRTNIIGKN